MPDVPRDEPDDARPWERPGAVRRAVPPHRGRVLELLGAAALVLSYFGPCALAAVPLAVCVCRMIGRDLRAMRAGRMDPAGRRETARARQFAIAGGIVAAPLAAFWAALVLVAFLTG